MSQLKKTFIDFLRKAFIKFAFLSILKVATPTGLKAKVIELAAKLIFKYAIDPSLDFAFRKAGVLVDKAKGEITLKKIQKAKDENDKDEYRRNIGNV